MNLNFIQTAGPCGDDCRRKDEQLHGNGLPIGPPLLKMMALEASLSCLGFDKVGLDKRERDVSCSH